MQEPDDPRAWPAAAPAFARAMHAQARDALDAATRLAGDRGDAGLRAAFEALLRAQDGARLAAVFDSAPSAAVYRHLWRALAQAEATSTGGAMDVSVFALPVVVVAGRTEGAQDFVTLPAVLGGAAGVALCLREHGALRGNQTFAVGDALVGADALALARLPQVLALRALPDNAAAPLAPPDLPPAPIRLSGDHESVHLRFVVGAAIAAAGVDLFEDTTAGRFGVPLARLLGADLARPGATVLALPHAPRRLVPALQAGLGLQREVSAQVFLSNALRRMRGSIGEPSAVISAHRSADSPSGGELRLSLSSPFGPRDAEGFRCPLYAVDRVADVVQMLATLLADCRVTDVRVLPGVHADRDGDTGVPLLFRADALH